MEIRDEFCADGVAIRASLKDGWNWMGSDKTIVVSVDIRSGDLEIRGLGEAIYAISIPLDEIEPIIKAWQTLREAG